MAELASFLPLIAIMVLFWALLIRPQQKRARELRAMQSALSAGDEVVLTSGIFGQVAETTDTHVLVEVADGVRLRVARGAIGQVLPKEGQSGIAAGPEENE